MSGTVGTYLDAELPTDLYVSLLIPPGDVDGRPDVLEIVAADQSTNPSTYVHVRLTPRAALDLADTLREHATRALHPAGVNRPRPPLVENRPRLTLVREVEP